MRLSGRIFQRIRQEAQGREVTQPRGGVYEERWGLVHLNNFLGLKSALGGTSAAVGYALTNWMEKRYPVVGFVFIDSHILEVADDLLGWAWVGPRPTCHNLTADRRWSTKPRLQV